MSGKEKKEVRRVDFPEISMERTMGILADVYEGYGKSKIIPNKDFEKIVGIHGGALAGIVGSLKQYGFLDKHSKNEYLITDTGLEALKTKSKAIVFGAWNSIKMHRKVFEQYGDNLADINKKVVERYLQDTEKLSDKDATKLSRLIVESYTYIKNLEVEQEPVMISKSTGLEKPTSGIPLADIYLMSRIIGGLSPPEEEVDINSRLEMLSKLAEKNNLKELSGLIVGLKVAYEDKPFDDVVKELGKSLSQIFGLFEKSIGISDEVQTLLNDVLITISKDETWNNRFKSKKEENKSQ